MYFIQHYFLNFSTILFTLFPNTFSRFLFLYDVYIYIPKLIIPKVANTGICNNLLLRLVGITNFINIIDKINISHEDIYLGNSLIVSLYLKSYFLCNI